MVTWRFWTTLVSRRDSSMKAYGSRDLTPQGLEDVTWKTLKSSLSYWKVTLNVTDVGPYVTGAPLLGHLGRAARTRIGALLGEPSDRGLRCLLLQWERCGPWSVGFLAVWLSRPGRGALGMNDLMVCRVASRFIYWRCVRHLMFIYGKVIWKSKHVISLSCSFVLLMKTCKSRNI